MKQPFYLKRVDPGVTAIFACGFADDKGDKKAKVVISVRASNMPRKSRAEHQKLCDALNKAWNDSLGGLL